MIERVKNRLRKRSGKNRIKQRLIIFSVLVALLLLLALLSQKYCYSKRTAKLSVNQQFSVLDLE